MARNVYTVSQVNSYIKNMFTQDIFLQLLQIKGEVSNCKYHTSGHLYFTLKDAGGTLNCVMFAGNRRGLSFPLTEGMQVIVTGNVDVYERDGKYQMYARSIVRDGIGSLYERYDALKRELEEMGMFSAEYKQPIPQYCGTIGVVTAPTGAAIRDIIQIARRRNPYVQIILYPAIVQGEKAVPSIVAGIRALEELQVDVMIVGRGGGSIEDLWAFNEREVAQAVFDCRVPVISAVGHETDTTIIDFVSDLRAPTPSAAAELAVCDIAKFSERLLQKRQQLEHGMAVLCQDKRRQLKMLQEHLQLRSPMGRIREQRTYLMHLEEKLQLGMENNLERAQQRLQLYTRQLSGLSPLKKLESGYAYITDADGRHVKSVEQTGEGQELSVRLFDGTIQARVCRIKKEEAAENTDGNRKN